MTKVIAQLNNLRISPQKVRLVAGRVRGLDVNEAISMMKYDLRKTAQPMEKLLKSAVANAENNYKLKSADLKVDDVIVCEGPTLKRWMPRAYGRATQILKRTSRVSIILAPKVVQEDIKNSKEEKSPSADASVKEVKSTEKKSKKVAADKK